MSSALHVRRSKNSEKTSSYIYRGAGAGPLRRCAAGAAWPAPRYVSGLTWRPPAACGRPRRRPRASARYCCSVHLVGPGTPRQRRRRARPWRRTYSGNTRQHRCSAWTICCGRCNGAT